MVLYLPAFNLLFIEGTQPLKDGLYNIRGHIVEIKNGARVSSINTQPIFEPMRNNYTAQGVRETENTQSKQDVKSHNSIYSGRTYLLNHLSDLTHGNEVGVLPEKKAVADRSHHGPNRATEEPRQVPGSKAVLSEKSNMVESTAKDLRVAGVLKPSPSDVSLSSTDSLDASDNNEIKNETRKRKSSLKRRKAPGSAMKEKRSVKFNSSIEFNDGFVWMLKDNEQKPTAGSIPPSFNRPLIDRLGHATDSPCIYSVPNPKDYSYPESVNLGLAAQTSGVIPGSGSPCLVSTAATDQIVGDLGLPKNGNSCNGGNSGIIETGTSHGSENPGLINCIAAQSSAPRLDLGTNLSSTRETPDGEERKTDFAEPNIYDSLEELPGSQHGNGQNGDELSVKDSLEDVAFSEENSRDITPGVASNRDQNKGNSNFDPKEQEHAIVGGDHMPRSYGSSISQRNEAGVGYKQECSNEGLSNETMQLPVGMRAQDDTAWDNAVKLNNNVSNITKERPQNHTILSSTTNAVASCGILSEADINSHRNRYAQMNNQDTHDESKQRVAHQPSTAPQNSTYHQQYMVDVAQRREALPRDGYDSYYVAPHHRSNDPPSQDSHIEAYRNTSRPVNPTTSQIAVTASDRYQQSDPNLQQQSIVGPQIALAKSHSVATGQYQNPYIHHSSQSSMQSKAYSPAYQYAEPVLMPHNQYSTSKVIPGSAYESLQRGDSDNPYHESRQVPSGLHQTTSQADPRPYEIIKIKQNLNSSSQNTSSVQRTYSQPTTMPYTTATTKGLQSTSDTYASRGHQTVPRESSTVTRSNTSKPQDTTSSYATRTPASTREIPVNPQTVAPAQPTRSVAKKSQVNSATVNPHGSGTLRNRGAVPYSDVTAINLDRVLNNKPSSKQNEEQDSDEEDDVISNIRKSMAELQFNSKWRPSSSTTDAAHPQYSEQQGNGNGQDFTQEIPRPSNKAKITNPEFPVDDTDKINQQSRINESSSRKSNIPVRVPAASVSSTVNPVNKTTQKADIVPHPPPGPKGRMFSRKHNRMDSPNQRNSPMRVINPTARGRNDLPFDENHRDLRRNNNNSNNNSNSNNNKEQYTTSRGASARNDHYSVDLNHNNRQVPSNNEGNREQSGKQYYYSEMPSGITQQDRHLQAKNEQLNENLNKTPTDDEINELWYNVRNCLTSKPPRKASSDSIYITSPSRQNRTWYGSSNVSNGRTGLRRQNSLHSAPVRRQGPNYNLRRYCSHDNLMRRENSLDNLTNNIHTRGRSALLPQRSSSSGKINTNFRAFSAKTSSTSSEPVPSYRTPSASRSKKNDSEFEILILFQLH